MDDLLRTPIVGGMSTHVILGGTGKVGRRLTRALREAGHTPRAVSRSTPLRFDWRDEASWPTVLDGADGVFIIGPGSAADWSNTLGRFLHAAVDAGVEHAVLLSARGVEFHPGGAVDTAEKALQAGPLAWTILRPTHFAQNFTEAMFTPLDGQIIAPVADGAEPFIDVDDIAEVGAVVLAGRGYDGRVLELSGPEAITFTEAAETLERVTGTSVRFSTESDDEHIARLRAAGTPDGYVQWRMAMLRGIRTGADAYLSTGVEEVLGRPATGFADWAAREAVAVTVTAP
ncbi:NAD(P)H-binding protein [Streptomyces sp. NPDC092369]|uniref:NAD(P)H-binding protein n=1 Tax=Streptomyces sp. NPDC092369 TaxID=3366015 RepID=UPI003805623F